MSPRRLTITDLCKVSDYSRHKMRGLLGQMPPFAKRVGEARVAAEFSAHDLIVVTVCCLLETRYRLRRSMVVRLSPHLASALSGPRPLAPGARLIIQFDPPSAEYVDQLNRLEEGLVLSLNSVFFVVDNYLLPNGLNNSGQQRELTVTVPVKTAGARGYAPEPTGLANTRAKKKAILR